MKRIIRQDGPKSTDRALVVHQPKALLAEARYSQQDPLISNHLRDSVGGPEKAGVGRFDPSLATILFK